jgi:SSS family solute:Na+ symporter
MTVLNAIDWVVIIGFFILIFTISARYSRQAGQNTRQFFLSGQNLPWYVAGTAMVATTFSADTPLAVTELVVKHGIAGNWLWWNMALGSVLTVFFFARLWRRSGMMTDVSFLEYRYSGKPAAFLRGFRALYLGLFMNAIIMAWVHQALIKIFRVIIPGFDPFVLVIISASLVLIYASLSGLPGTARTDSFQFVFAMTGCIILAVKVIQSPEIGGLVSLKDHLEPQVLQFFPRIGHLPVSHAAGGILGLTVGAMAAYCLLQWWSSWYPGADPGGGSYIAQRMLSAKDERHSFLATLWFTIAHYTIRPWPWILVALSAIVILPRSESKETLKAQDPQRYEIVSSAYPDRSKINVGDPDLCSFYDQYENTVDPGILYPKMMVRNLGPGWLGLLTAVFLAAYISTVAAQLNWGTSYIIHDFYKRFISPGASEITLVMISRIFMIILTGISLCIAGWLLTSISGAWVFIINASAGLGGVLILRWYWWRINAWSELTAMIVPLLLYPLVVLVMKLEPPVTLFPVVLGSTAAWILVTFFTRPVDRSMLTAFYRKIQPPGPGWSTVSQRSIHSGEKSLLSMTLEWCCGVVMIYCALFGMGSLLFREYLKAGFDFLAVLLAGVWIYRSYRKEGQS